MTRYQFAFAPEYRLPALAFGITPRTAWVDLTDDQLAVRYGPWRLRTPVANITDVCLTENYTRIKTIGPPHLSFTDRGVSFTTNNRRGVCVLFRQPVAGIDPSRMIKHPGATMTVEDPDALAADVRRVAGLG